MDHDEAELGGRLPLIPEAALEGEGRKLYQDMQRSVAPWAAKAGFTVTTSTGEFIGPFNALLRSPKLAESVLRFQLEEMQRSSLAPRLREVVILTVGATWRPDYEIYAHSIAGRSAGLSADNIAALVAENGAPELSEEEDTARQVAFQLSSTHRVDAALYEKALALFGESGLTDIAVLVGNYCLVSCLLGLFEVPAPDR